MAGATAAPFFSLLPCLKYPSSPFLDVNSLSVDAQTQVLPDETENDRLWQRQGRLHPSLASGLPFPESPDQQDMDSYGR